VGSAISSMTGFARAEGAHEEWRWVWEVKSVNGRGLEMRSRIPNGFDDLEPDLRKAAKKTLHRGSLNIALSLRQDTGEARYRVNQAALDNALVMIETISKQTKCEPPRASDILSLRGVMELDDVTDCDEARQALKGALLLSFDDALKALGAARGGEGDALAAILEGQLKAIEQLSNEARGLAAVTPKALRDKLAAQLKDLLSGSPIPEERLVQEAALLAVKADIREELDRLDSHVAAGRALLSEAGPVGRALDFLTQEFNREANTLCSKASDMALKRIGLELKKTIDQMREQVQNVE